MNIELYDKIENDFKGGDHMAVLAKDMYLVLVLRK